MNEQIRNLLDEAGLALYQGDFRMRRLIKLVAKECVTQIEKVNQLNAGNPSTEYRQGFEDGILVSARTIKEYFDASLVPQVLPTKRSPK